ncbi:MAG: TolC family protein [Gemmatimonadales bacterium]
MLPFLVMVAVAAAPIGSSAPAGSRPIAAQDSALRISLADAIARATKLDPNYVRAIGQVGSAEWARKSARSAFVLPSLSVGSDLSKYSVEIFNTGTGQRATSIVTARADARFELFTGGRKLADLKRLDAELEGAKAGEAQALFLTALATERDYYEVLGGRELVDVARDRLRRAEEQLVVARARVVSGAVVQTDSLQILLEVNRARVALLREEANLSVARLQLGRRVGVRGPADAAPLDSTLPREMPVDLPAAVALALEQGPDWRIARSNEVAANASLRARKAVYLPQANLNASYSKFGDSFFPAGLSRGSLTLSISYPLWDNLQRELNLKRAQLARDLARAQREDLELAAEVDVTEAYEAHRTALATARYAEQAVAVARENFRVQEARYRNGASTILDLLDGQSQLTGAQAELVQARYATRLALAGLEALVGRRFHDIGE